MDRLYEELRATFDLEDRFRALEHKLQVIQESCVLLLDTVRDSRLYNADLVIIVLIAFEIVLSLYDRLKIHLGY